MTPPARGKRRGGGRGRRGGRGVFLEPLLSPRLVVVSGSGICRAGFAGSFLTQFPLHNSWSDTGSASGPNGRKRVKDGVSGPAEDLRPVSEVESGVNFRPANGVRGQVAGSLPRRQPGTGTRQHSGGGVVISFHPTGGSCYPFCVTSNVERELGNLVGWRRESGTTRSGIWVLKGGARTRMLPAIFDHLRVGWRKQGFIRDRLGHARARLSVSIRVWAWSSRQTTN